MIRPLGVAVLAISTLSACTPVNSMIERWFPSEETTAAQPVTRPAVAVAVAVVPPLPRRKPEAISELTLVDADPQQLVGLDFDGTKALLGDPVAKMEQPPAKVWAYAGGGCMLSVFFYPSVDDRGFRVLAYEITDAADVLDIQWLSDPPVAAPEMPPAMPKVLKKDESIIRHCFAEFLHQQDSIAG
jgi:hypothetical protein